MNKTLALAAVVVGTHCLTITGLFPVKDCKAAEGTTNPSVLPKPVPLPLPAARVPDNPPIQPTVITAEGQRLLLNSLDVKIAYRPRRGLTGASALAVNRVGWWIINYPLEKIKGFEGKSCDEICRTIFNLPASEVKNWYVKTPGKPASEPPEPMGPAPIELTPNPTIIVEGGNRWASDENPGTAAKPFKTISAAVKKAGSGDIIHVYPGIYRESVEIRLNATAEKPLRLEGVRGKSGDLPVISGNDLFPADSWKSVEGLPGVYRAEIFTRLMGAVSADGRTLIERSLPGELKEDEYCFNRGTREFLNFRFDGKVEPAEGTPAGDKTWRKAAVDKDGFLDFDALFGPETTNAVIWASTHVWVAPKEKGKIEWNPNFPEPVTGRLETEGPFRAFRRTGGVLRSQVNKFRIWVNGALVPSCIRSTAFDDEEYRNFPRVYRLSGGSAERIDNFTLREGWNHLVFQFDTSSRPKGLRFKFKTPNGIGGYVSCAEKPPETAKPTAGAEKPHISEYLVIGPFPGEPDRGIYVRLKKGKDPNTVPMDLAARGGGGHHLLRIAGSFLHVSGFEIRHGATFQQRGLVHIFGEGSLIEGCLIRDCEVGGIGFSSFLYEERDKTITKILDQTSQPTVIRNNWIINPGNVGIGGGASSGYLTAENQNTTAPGRSRFLIEHNRIFNNNWTGIAPFWESGGMKVFRLTGSTIRYNTIVGGTGPGIWLDWEHYGNRLEGNLSLTGWAMLLGVEASPGPQLWANNICVNLRPGEVWFRYALLSWNSVRDWAINNTIDGRWNKTPAWGGQTGGDGIGIRWHTGGGDRGTLWGNLPDHTNVLMNNIIVGCNRALAGGSEKIDAVNVTDRGIGAFHLAADPEFVNPEKINYRLKPDSVLNVIGARDNPYTKRVKHDFYGLLRFDEDGRAVGAVRMEREPLLKGVMVELETTGGAVKRLYKVKPLSALKTYNLLQADKVYKLPGPGDEWKGSPEYMEGGKVLWSLFYIPKGNVLNETFGADRKSWGGPMDYDEKNSIFCHAGVRYNRDYRKLPYFGAWGAERPVLVFTAPEKGKYLVYLHPGYISSAHTMGLNIVVFRKGSPEGKSIHYFQTSCKDGKPLVLNLVADLQANDEVALIVDTDAGSVSLTGENIWMAYFRD